MRKSIVIGLAGIVVLGMLVVFFFLSRRSVPPPPESRALTFSGQTTGATDTSSTKDRVAGFMKRRAEDIRVYVEACDVPIKFFGKVVDQDNQPLEGVKIGGGIMHGYITISGEGSSKDVKYTAHTDANGNFTIEGMKGFILGIDEMQKQGYELSKKATLSFSFGVQSPTPFVPDVNRPVVFQMWKKEEPAARLVKGDGFYGIIPDGRIFTIDLVGKKKIEGAVDGDLRVWIKRPAQADYQKARYDWSFEMEALNGGIIETKDEFMYRAPEGGYQPCYGLRMNALDSDWKPRIEKQFYVKSRDGKVYTRMLVEVFSVYNSTAVFSVKYYSNPDGSRNLEYDGERTKLVQP